MEARIKLSESDLTYLRSYKEGKRSLREYNRLNILLLLDKGKKTGEIEDFLGIDRITIWRVKKKYLKQGVEKALEEEARTGQPAKYSTDQHAELAALACGPCPAGRRRWTVRLLTEELKKRKGFETVNRESVRLGLKKMNVSLG